MSRKKKHEHVNHERWLVSYADFITLVFAIFVVLFASSQSDKKKQIQISAAMQTAFTPLGMFEAHSTKPPLAEGNNAAKNVSPAALSLPLPSTRVETMEETEGHLNKLFTAQMAAGQIPPGSATMHATAAGLVISLHEAASFAAASAAAWRTSVPGHSKMAAALP